MESAVRYEIQGDVAVVTLDAPGEKVNVLNADFLQQLETTAEKLATEKAIIGAVVISGKGGGFIAGADIRQIEGVKSVPEGTELARQGQHILQHFGQFTFPVVAAVNGHCMGGGTEFILACNYRIAAIDAAIALPEIKLGILPGFGGTQRLPRLISLEKAVDIILSGRTVRAAEAKRIGLVDRVVDKGELLEKAIELVREAAIDEAKLLAARRSKSKGLRALLLEKNPLGRRLLFSIARKGVLKKTGGHYPAPLRALEVIREGVATSIDRGLELEAAALGEMIVTRESKNLVHLFFLSQRAKKAGGVDAQPAAIDRAAVLGAGVMGGGIAQLLAAKKVPVLLKDIRQEAVTTGLNRAREIFSKKLARQGKGEEEVAASMALITGTIGYRDFDQLDLVIEAVLEKMPVKQAVLREVEPLLGPNAFFATNTSALSVTELQTAAARPERVGGMHFFNPVDKMPLVEIIRGEKTSDETVATLFQATSRLGKTPIVTTDTPGFLVNRLLVIYLNEACLMAEEGVDWPSLDRIISDFGLPMGPFRLIDEVGIDIGAEVGSHLCHSFDYLVESGLMTKASDLGLLGKKGEKGFYRYSQGHTTGPNLAIDAQLGLEKERQATREDLERMLYLMVNEAGRCLEEGVVLAAEDIDTGMVFGTGFPPFRGGLCRWADSVGLPKIASTLGKLAQQHGRRFEPCSFLVEKERFYPD